MKKIITGLCFLLATATMQLCAQQGLADSDLFNKISMIKAIDNHAHPLKYITKDGKPDDEYDALP
ncbi:MAG: hypothetical protein ABJA57_07505, partial [Ginsengibacter sp.]